MLNYYKRKELIVMKVAIVYYSMSSNTKYVAEKIARCLGADLISLVPEEQYPDKGFKKYFWGGKSALMKDKPVLKEYSFDGKKYDVIVFGTPVWASCYTPPLRTFILDHQQELLGKKICAFACYSGSGSLKALEKLQKDLNIESFDAKISLIDPKDKPTSKKDGQIEDFCKQKELF